MNPLIIILIAITIKFAPSSQKQAAIDVAPMQSLLLERSTQNSWNARVSPNMPPVNFAFSSNTTLTTSSQGQAPQTIDLQSIITAPQPLTWHSLSRVNVGNINIRWTQSPSGLTFTIDQPGQNPQTIRSRWIQTPATPSLPTSPSNPKHHPIPRATPAS